MPTIDIFSVACLPAREHGTGFFARAKTTVPANAVVKSSLNCACQPRFGISACRNSSLWTNFGSSGWASLTVLLLLSVGLGGLMFAAVLYYPVLSASSKTRLNLDCRLRLSEQKVVKNT